jgi:hypothetical protein
MILSGWPSVRMGPGSNCTGTLTGAQGYWLLLLLLLLLGSWGGGCLYDLLCVCVFAGWIEVLIAAYASHTNMLLLPIDPCHDRVRFFMRDIWELYEGKKAQQSLLLLLHQLLQLYLLSTRLLCPVCTLRCCLLDVLHVRWC